jgi:hypothetical protein
VATLLWEFLFGKTLATADKQGIHHGDPAILSKREYKFLKGGR